MQSQFKIKQHLDTICLAVKPLYCVTDYNAISPILLSWRENSCHANILTPSMGLYTIISQGSEIITILELNLSVNHTTFFPKTMNPSVAKSSLTWWLMIWHYYFVSKLHNVFFACGGWYMVLSGGGWFGGYWVGDITLIASLMGPTWSRSGADRTQVGPILAPWTLLSG